MYLEKLEAQGFKSFANKTELVFPARGKGTNPGTAAIIGPNGSGKSNVADAVRWVLGEQSLKLLRGKKAEDVIFSGSNKKARLGFAEVALYLNNEDKKADIEYTQVVVKRRVYRDGSSEYYINNSKVRLTDVQLLLAQANFGQRTYSVIGQGMADAILSYTPQERKNFFDEATGVKQYQIKKDQAITKLETTEENLTQAQALLKEMTPRVKSLERQIERLQKRSELEKQLSELHVTYYGSLWHEMHTQYESLNDQKKSISKDHLAITKKIAECQQKLKTLEKKQTTNSEFDTKQKEYFEAMNEKNALVSKLSLLEKDLALLSVKQAHGPVAIDTKKLVETTRKHISFLDRFQKAEELTEFQTLQKEASPIHKTFTTILDGEEEKADPKQEQSIKEAQEKIATLKKELAESEKAIAEKQKAIADMRRAETRTTSGLFELQKEYQQLQQQLNTISGKKNSIEVELARVETHRSDVEEQLEKGVSRSLHTDIKQFKKADPDAKNLWPQIAKVRHELEMIGGIDPAVNEEYQEAKERFDFLTTQTTDLTETLGKIKHGIKELDAIIEKEFNASFKTIEQGFVEYFKILFNGGTAGLILHKQSALDAMNEELVAELSEEEQETLAHQYKMGIEIKASPPNKKVNSISMLSGGERALTSIALICAIIHANPSPFVVLDEVDAALDEANSERFAHILEKLSNETQFIAITHNRATMETASILYGVTMGDDGVSKLLSIDLEDAVKQIGE